MASKTQIVKRPKRINMNKLFDEFVAAPVVSHDEEGPDEECRAMQLLRNMWRTAEDPENKDSGMMSRYLMDHMMGRPTVKVALAIPQGIQIDASGAAVAMLGLSSITGTFVNADGEAEEMTVLPKTTPLDD